MRRADTLPVFLRAVGSHWGSCLCAIRKCHNNMPPKKGKKGKKAKKGEEADGEGGGTKTPLPTDKEVLLQQE